MTVVRAGSDPGADARYDVIVVGAGVGGIYAVHRFVELGLTVAAIEGGSGVGGVWNHNRYPGARVDLESLDYSYQFSPSIARAWTWTERYAAQPELESYLKFVVDALDVRRYFLFRTWVTAAEWEPQSATWRVTTSSDAVLACRYLIMATGNLSAARRPAFPGLEEFRGEWVLTSHWPEQGVDLDGRRVGVIGTGSSGVQVATALAARTERLCIFQRTANYSVPAQNYPLDAGAQRQRADRLSDERAFLLAGPGGSRVRRAAHPLGHYSEAEQQAALQRQWDRGGQGMTAVFADQGVDLAANDVVAGFVRTKVRERVSKSEVADSLCSQPYPIGTRRLILDTGYYEIFDQDNVTLVDLRGDPTLIVTPTGICARGRDYELDVIVFALGFRAFSGALVDAGLRNEQGIGFAQAWARGPRTLLGLMTSGFPNLFLPTGPGSPSVLSNMILMNEFHVDWIADCIAYLDDHGYRSIGPTVEGEARWGETVAEAASKLLRLRVDNYMVHVNRDGSRVFMPYPGGLDRYVAMAGATADSGYKGFALA